MRLRRARGGFAAELDDGRTVRFGWGLLAVLAAPVVIGVGAIVWQSPTGDVVSDVDTALRNLTGSEPVRRLSALPSVEIGIGNNTFLDLERALAEGDPELRHEEGGDRPFLNAWFLEDGGPVPCEIAFLAPPRHHDAEKPSLRIKFMKVDARAGARRIDLYRPEDPLAIDAYMYSRLARELDVIDEELQHARLFVNRRFFGLYYRALPPGPVVEAACRRMTGTFVFSKPGEDPWSDVEAWTRFGRDETDPVPLDELLAALRGDPDAEPLDHIVDYDAFAKWSAVREVLGRVDDPDGQIALFFNSSHGLIEPVAWSFDGLRGPADRRVGTEGALLSRLAVDEAWVRTRNRWIATLRTALDALVGELPALHARLAPELAADVRLVARDDRSRPARGFPVTRLDERRAEFAAWLAERRAVIDAHVAGAEIEIVPAEDVVLGPGPILLDEDVVTAPRQRLVIRAGTTIRFAGGVGVHARGPVRVEGTEADPVVLRGTAWEPWRSFAIVGPYTAGSRLSDMRIEDASSGRFAHRKLEANFVVHDCPDIVLERCWFGSGGGDDDTLRITRSKARLERCTIVDARRDGIDIALSDVAITACEVAVARRNAIDVMGSVVRIERSRLDGALRAALSVGEGARVTCDESILSRSDFGLECHDGGRALVRSTRLEGNRIAVQCEHDDWRFDRGGAVALVSCVVSRSLETDADVARLGELLLVGTGSIRVGRGERRVSVVDSLPVDWLER